MSPLGPNHLSTLRERKREALKCKRPATSNQSWTNHRRREERVDRVTVSQPKNEHRYHSIGEATVSSNRSKPTIHHRRRQLQHPRLPPVLHHHRRLRRRWLPLRYKAGHKRTVDGDGWADRVDGWVHVRLPELCGSADGFFP